MAHEHHFEINDDDHVGEQDHAHLRLVADAPILADHPLLRKESDEQQADAPMVGAYEYILPIGPLVEVFAILALPVVARRRNGLLEGVLVIGDSPAEDGSRSKEGVVELVHDNFEEDAAAEKGDDAISE